MKGAVGSCFGEGRGEGTSLSKECSKYRVAASTEIAFEVSTVFRFMVVYDASTNITLLFYIVRKPADFKYTSIKKSSLLRL